VNKRNLIIQAAVAGAFAVASFSANAGVANGFPLQMAIQAVTGTTTPPAIVTGQLAYSTVAPIPIGTSYVYVKLNGGALLLAAANGTITGGAADTAGALTTAGALQVANAGVQTTIVVGAGTASADQTFIVFPITVTNASVPVNTTFTYSPGATAALGALQSVPASVVAGGTQTGTISIGTVPTLTAGGSALATSTNVDTPASGGLLQFTAGETFTAMSSGAATFSSSVANGGMVGVGQETAQINVTSSAGVAFINNVNVAASTSLLNFGGFYFKDVPFVVGANGAAFNIATDYTAATSSAVITGNFGAAAGTGGKVFLSVSNACASTLGTAAVLSSNNTIATVSNIPAFTNSVPTFVCMQLNTGNAIPVPATTPSITVNMVGTSTATATFSGTGTLYPLTTNGGSVYVRSYIPAAAAGYTSYIRVINSGSIAANISASVVDATTGVTGPAGVIATNVAPGGAVTVPSSTIEAAIVAAGGTALPASARPRLLITGPTTLSVQSFFLSQGNGNFNEVSSGNNVPGAAGQ